MSNLSGSRFGRNKCLRNILNIQMLNRKFDLYREHLTLSMRVLPSIKLFQAVADIRTWNIIWTVYHLICKITAIQLVDHFTFTFQIILHDNDSFRVPKPWVYVEMVLINLFLCPTDLSTAQATET